jgi:hypothetical protein
LVSGYGESYMQAKTGHEQSSQTEQRAVQAQPGLAGQRMPGPGGNAGIVLGLQRTHGNRFVQRFLERSVLQRNCGCGGTCADCGSKQSDQDQGGEVYGLQRSSAVQPEPYAAPPLVSEVLGSSGKPLDASTRAFMEPRFSHDFQDVRIHTGMKASESAKAVSALAYTVGRDIVFAEGQYAPDSQRGRHLLAHELAHTIQQRGASVQQDLSIGEADTPWEREADQVAQAVAEGPAGSSFQPRTQPPVASPAGGESLTPADEDGTPMGADYSPGTGALVGGITGALTGAGIGALIGGPIGAGVGAVLGGLVGAAIGYATGGPTLTYSTVTPRTVTNCGGYTYAAQWGLNGASATTNGFVVQKLRFDLKREICAGGRDDFAKTYWEAWQVRNGNIFVGTSTTPHRADTFSVGATPGEKGVNLEEGNARFIEGYTEPLTWGRVPEARDLPATTTAPAGWSDTGTVHRSVRVAFDCCSGTDPGQISGDG